MITKPSVNTES